MGQYALRRLLLIFPTIILVTMIVFSLVRLIPGDVAQLMVENYKYADTVDILRHKLGLDRPIYEQYLTWIGNMATGNFGASLWTQRAITDELGQRIPVSMQLGLMTMVVSFSISIPIGVISAVRQDSWADYVFRVLAIGGLSVPGFWMATLVVTLPSIWFHWSPSLQFVPFSQDPVANIGQFIFPALLLGIERAASVMRMTRAMMLEVLRQDYIRTAWAKGLREFVVIYRHALKNAMIPVITIIGIQIPFILGGSIIMESIFALPGMGRFMLEIISMRDYPMLQAVNVVFAAIIVFVNFGVDLTYGYLDPRIRYS